MSFSEKTVISNQAGTQTAEPNASGKLPVEAEISNISTSAFGEQVTVQPRPFVQSVFSYDLIPANFREFTSGSGSTGAENKMLFCKTGTSAGGYGAVQSFRSLNYKAGEGGKARFTAIFESAVANSWQGVGLVNIGDELSFGYDGTTFGIWHRRNGLAEVRTITVTGAAGGSENLTLTLNGVGYTIPLTAGTVEHNAWEIEDWLNSNQSIWAADQIDDTVVISALSDGAKSGSYSFSSSTATGGIALNTTGATKTSTHIAQADWNGETVSFDPTKGNVYQIKFQYLGFGNIFFEVEDPTSGVLKTVHTLRYSNLNTTPSLGNPSLKFGAYCVSLGSTSDLVVRSASVGLFVEGLEGRTRNPRSVIHTQSIGITETAVLTLRNRRTYNGYVNQVEIEPTLLSVAAEGAKNIELRVRATSDTGVEQNFTAAGTNLVSDVDTTAIAFSGGSILLPTTVAGGGDKDIDLSNYRIRIPPGLRLVVTAKRASGANADVTVGLGYYEDI